MPMTESSLPCTQERRIEAERRLVRAAAELVGEIGPGKVTLANVGERAGYSRGLATHHFGSKGALMQRLVETVTNQFRDAMAEESQSDSPIDQLRQLIDFYFTVVSDLHPVNRARLVLWADAVAGWCEISAHRWTTGFNTASARGSTSSACSWTTSAIAASTRIWK
jgi:AcrR family transcriptional regulator